MRKGARAKPAPQMEQTKKKFLKNMVGFSMMTWISFVIGFIASPIATRLFVPDELGKVNMFGSYAALISSFCYLGLDQAFVRFFREPPGRLTQKGLFTFCTLVPLGFSVLSSLVLVFSWRWFSYQVMGRPDFSVFLCLCLYSVSLVVYRFLSLCYRMEQNARLYTVQGVVQVLLTKIAYLAVGLGNATGKAALICLTVLMGLFTLGFILIQRSRFDPHFATQMDKPAFRELAAFALPLVPMSILSWLNTDISRVVLRQLLGFSATGIYSSALGLAATINIIQTGFNAYWAPYVFENYQSDDRRRFYTVHRLMACLLTFFGLLITLLQSPVFLLLGKSYRSSVVFFPFLFLSPICYCLGETTGMGITISKKTYWSTLIFLFSVIVNIGLCYLLIPLMGMTGAAVSSAASAVLTLLLRTLIGERYYKAIERYRYLAYTIGLMLAASVGNLLLTGPAKYLLLLVLLAAAFALYRPELKTLWATGMQIAKAGRGALKRRAGKADGEDRHESK